MHLICMYSVSRVKQEPLYIHLWKLKSQFNTFDCLKLSWVYTASVEIQQRGFFISWITTRMYQVNFNGLFSNPLYGLFLFLTVISRNRWNGQKGKVYIEYTLSSAVENLYQLTRLLTVNVSWWMKGCMFWGLSTSSDKCIMGNTHTHSDTQNRCCLMRRLPAINAC